MTANHFLPLAGFSTNCWPVFHHSSFYYDEIVGFLLDGEKKR